MLASPAGSATRSGWGGWLVLAGWLGVAWLGVAWHLGLRGRAGQRAMMWRRRARRLELMRRARRLGWPGPVLGGRGGGGGLGP